MTTRRRGRRGGIVIPVVLLALLAAIIAVRLYGAVSGLPPILAEPGCAAGNSHSTISLDPEQAAIAATIAGVAQQRGMPPRAVTVAYAAAMQESKLHDLDYGDRDSVGVFQQRPSEGWGPASKLTDPVYATTRFFEALTDVPRYRHIPVYQAAQAVQHSADGQAYIQYERMAARMTAAFTGRLPHAVWCWPGNPPAAKADLSTVTTGLEHTFGRVSTQAAARPHDAPSLTVPATTRGFGWSVAAWLVTHSSQFHLHQVSYDRYEWRVAGTSKGWTPDQSAAPSEGVMAS